MALTRDEAHRLIDELDAADVAAAVAVLQQLVEGVPQRSFHGFDSFDGEPDLSERVSDILRAELGSSVATRRRA